MLLMEEGGLLQPGALSLHYQVPSSAPAQFSSSVFCPAFLKLVAANHAAAPSRIPKARIGGVRFQ
jgi:hypothetical protein